MLFESLTLFDLSNGVDLFLEYARDRSRPIKERRKWLMMATEQAREYERRCQAGGNNTRIYPAKFRLS